ncbi:hypothetical protein IF1G_07083 [Cordyceps javanica]|uniref:Uncharacterized protein n=1 Tax=Cordyceps javanica TaxID=43265 RepID=A0A545UXK2_9HYPO|nr:hypothetical protein IF1G_07083 [Cordyceps javanica]
MLNKRDIFSRYRHEHCFRLSVQTCLGHAVMHVSTFGTSTFTSSTTPYARYYWCKAFSRVLNMHASQRHAACTRRSIQSPVTRLAALGYYNRSMAYGVCQICA